VVESSSAGVLRDEGASPLIMGPRLLKRGLEDGGVLGLFQRALGYASASSSTFDITTHFRLNEILLCAVLLRRGVECRLLSQGSLFSKRIEIDLVYLLLDLFVELVCLQVLVL
jgi:hypothetical protein